MAIDVCVWMPVAMGVAPCYCAVDNGDEMAPEKRHASSWPSREERPERVDLGRVGAL